MKTQKIPSWLPIFPGFYNTVFESDESDEIYAYNQDNGTKKVYEDFEWDFDSYRTGVASGCVSAIQDQLNKLGFKLKITYDGLDSPKYYNYRNDYINATYRLETGCIQLVKAYVNDNFDAWVDYLTEKFTSRLGWISPETTDPYEWLKRVSISAMVKDSNYAGVIFGFILTNKGYTTEDLYHAVEETSYLSYEVKEFELYELNTSGMAKAIEAYRNAKELSRYTPDIEISDLIEADGLRFDYSGNPLNMQGNPPEAEDPNQLNLF